VIAGGTILDDHAVYDESTLTRIAAAAVADGAEVLITTAKDRIKITDPGKLLLPLWTLNMRLGFASGRDRLEEMILAARCGDSSRAGL
jgi:tetraacyldisaccharide-1-P 4'-kinase